MKKKNNISFLVFFFIIIISNNFSYELPDSITAKLNNPNIEEKINAYENAISFFLRNSPNKSIEYAEEALEIARENKYRKGEADILFLLGVSYHAQSKYRQSLTNYELSLEIRKAENDNVGIGECLGRIALIYNVRGDFAKSLDCAQQAVNILEAQDDKTALGRAYNYLGIAYYVTENIEKAEETSLAALKFCETIGDDLVLAISHEHLAIIYIKKEDFKKAIFHVNKTIELRSKKSDSLGLAGSYENMALIFRLQKKYIEALNYYQKSLYIKEKLDNQRGLASTLAGMGVTFNRLGEYDKGISYLKRSIVIRKNLGDLRGMVSSLTQIGSAYEMVLDYKNALQYFKQAKSYSDSLLDEQKNKAIASIQEEFQNERKEKEILLLQKENTINIQTRNFLIIFSILLSIAAIAILISYRSKLKINNFLKTRNSEVTKQKEKVEQLNEQLKELNGTKNKLFSIIAHDLKSPFQGLLGLTQIMSEEFDDLSQEEIKHYTELMQNSSNSIYRLLENLLEWAYLQRDMIKFELAPISLNEIATDILDIQSTNAISKKITLTNNISDDIFISADKNMLYTILRNLISNAIKFTSQNGKVELSAFQNKDSVNICIKDNGIGIPKAFLDKLFDVGEKTSRPGTDGETSTGLGLVLCKEYIDKHKGKISVESTEGIGTTFCFSIPKNHKLEIV